MTKTVFRVPAIPDCREYRYSSQTAGRDPRALVFEGWVQLLHMISRFNCGELAATIQADFDPKIKYLQQRLNWSLHFRTGDSLPPEVVHALVLRGPVSNYYDFTINSFSDDLPDFEAAAEILRPEESLIPSVPDEDNPAFEKIRIYYTTHPFIPRDNNDYLLLDRLLSRVDEPVRIQWRVEPADEAAVRRTLISYIGHMMSINQGRDELLLDGVKREIRGSLSQGLEQTSVFARPPKRDPIADEFLRPLQEQQQRLRDRHLHFDIRVFSRTRETASLVASTVAESGLCEGQYQLIVHDRKSEWFEGLLQVMKSGEPFYDSFSATWFANRPAKGTALLRKLARMAPVEELRSLWHLPVGGTGSPTCMYKSTDPGFSQYSKRILSNGSLFGERSRQPTITVGYDMEMGLPTPSIRSSQSLEDIFDGHECPTPLAEFDLQLFKKHVFVTGVPGSGKTTVVFNLLIQLHRFGIPFLVIEPAKTEYRVFKALTTHKDDVVRSLARSLRVYTPGNEAISPLRFNPLAYPRREVSRDQHIDALINCFKAGMEMFGPMEAVISESLEIAYQIAERKMAESESGDSLFPTMVALLESIHRVVESKGYEGEVKSNITAATEVRIGNLTRRSVGKVFEHADSCPDLSDLITFPTVIEMEHMGVENACLMTLFILAGMRELIRSRPSGSPLRHVIVIEEAHNIVGRTHDGGRDQSNPKAFAAEYVTRMLAEMRALGEGIVIIDQLPSTVASEVIKNTGTKIALRQVSQDDREDLAGTMLLETEQALELARLKVGEAFLYHEALHGPRRVRCLNSAEYLMWLQHNATVEDIPRTLDLDKVHPSGGRLLEFIAAEPWYEAGLYRRLEHLRQQIESFNKLCDHKSLWLESIDEAAYGDAGHPGQLALLLDRLERQWAEMEAAFWQLYDDHYSPLIIQVSASCLKGETREFADAIEEVMGTNIVPAMQAFNEYYHEIKQRVTELCQKTGN